MNLGQLLKQLQRLEHQGVSHETPVAVSGGYDHSYSPVADVDIVTAEHNPDVPGRRYLEYWDDENLSPGAGKIQIIALHRG